MKILFSPSEAKTLMEKYEPLSKNSLFLKEIYNGRLKVLQKYQNFINKASNEQLKKLFGIKDESEIKKLNGDIFSKKSAKAIEVYSGVAFEYLNYNSLNIETQNYIDNNTLIFSNLFGVLLAKDKIPYYKLKQGEKIDSFDTSKYYSEVLESSLDKFLENEFILDLRANYYQKFYKIKSNHISMKFIKNGKVVSHFAKAYRGKILQEVAKNKVTSKDELLKINFKDVRFLEIIESKNRGEIVFEVI